MIVAKITSVKRFGALNTRDKVHHLRQDIKTNLLSFSLQRKESKVLRRNIAC